MIHALFPWFEPVAGSLAKRPPVPPKKMVHTYASTETYPAPICSATRSDTTLNDFSCAGRPVDGFRNSLTHRCGPITL
ncbi:hypothetical protein Y88_0711 [Novosphingobium nitrogenifigens DSM 19370]|uniref:Uncharacterized protein n=1 Tax=Novosphingobium nitrogenifigens DSM 19370 TaxID=983920 RepID=F1Z9T8_9SPHN|nr:hypothetical protein Y88_0711 [Novosphingobium nitrogenifigens DSM 19370]